MADTKNNSVQAPGGSPLTRWKYGDILDDAHLNEGLDAIEHLRGAVSLAGNPLPRRNSPFMCRVTKDAGADGTQTSPATWRYSVRDMDGNPLGSQIELYFPRENGTRSFAAADTFAIAFYVGDTLWLAQVAEKYGTGACP